MSQNPFAKDPNIIKHLEREYEDAMSYVAEARHHPTKSDDPRERYDAIVQMTEDMNLAQLLSMRLIAEQVRVANVLAFYSMPADGRRRLELDHSLGNIDLQALTSELGIGDSSEY